MCAALLLAVDDKYLHLLLKNILHPGSDRWREGSLASCFAYTHSRRFLYNAAGERGERETEGDGS